MIFFPHDFQFSAVSSCVIASNASQAIIQMAKRAKRIYGSRIQICDGTADDVQIQAAIAALPSNGGSIFLSEGTFSTSAEITITNPVTIQGAGRSATNIDTINDTFDAISFEPSSAWTEKGAKLADFKVSGGRYGCYINTNAIKTTLENIDFFSQSDFGLYDAGSQNCGFYNLHFYNCGRASAATGGIHLAGNSMQFYNTRVDSCGTGIIIDAGYDSAFYGLYVEGNQFHGIRSDSGTLASLAITGLGMEVNNVSATPNTYDIFLTSGTNVTIIGARLVSTLVTKAIYSTINGLGLYNISAQSVASTITGARGYLGADCLWASSSDVRPGQGGRHFTDSGEYFFGGDSVEKKYTRLRNINDWTETAPAGGVVILRTAGGLDTDFTATQSAGNKGVFGVVVTDIDYATYGYIQTRGKVTNLKVNGTLDIAIGDYLSCLDTKWMARKAASGHTAFAIALEAYTGDDDNGVIDALLIDPVYVA